MIPKIFFLAYLVVNYWSSPAFGQVSTIGDSNVAVGPQYDSTHVYVAPADVDRIREKLFSLPAGGTISTKPVVTTVTPTPSSTVSQLLQTPVGMVSVFGFRTPIPAPFGTERTGYLVTDMDVAVRLARASGADLIVAPFADPIGKDAVIQWPGGVWMQLYWHTRTPAYPRLPHIPENRVYVSADRIEAFMDGFLRFSHGRVVSDDASCPGIEIGRTVGTYRRVRIESLFGKLTAIVTDGHLNYPYGRETTGYEVEDLDATLARGKDVGLVVLVAPYTSANRRSVMVQFPGGYIAEIHADSRERR